MGGQFDSADEARLFQACEKILLDIPEQGNIMSCALDIKRLVPMLRKTGFSRDATPAAIRKVFHQNQDVIIPLPDDISFIHVKKFNGESGGTDPRKPWAKAGDYEDNTCNFWDAPASLGDLEHETEGDDSGHTVATQQSLKEELFPSIVKEQPMQVGETTGEKGKFKEAGLDLSQVDKSRIVGPQNVQFKKLGMETTEHKEEQHMPGQAVAQQMIDSRSRVTIGTNGSLRQPTKLAANAPNKKCAAGWKDDDAPLKFERHAPASPQLRKPAPGLAPIAATTPQTVPLQSSLKVEAPVKRNEEVDGKETPTGTIRVAPARDGQGVAVGVPEHRIAKEEPGLQDIQEQLVQLKQCQDEISRLLNQRHAMEEQITAKVAKLAKMPGYEVAAHQLAEELARVAGEGQQMLAVHSKPSFSATPSSGTSSREGGERMAACVNKEASLCGGQQTVEGKVPGVLREEVKEEGDVEVLDAPDAAEEWARRREAAQKRKRRGEGGEMDKEVLRKRAKPLQRKKESDRAQMGHVSVQQPQGREQERGRKEADGRNGEASPGGQQNGGPARDGPAWTAIAAAPLPKESPFSEQERAHGMACEALGATSGAEKSLKGVEDAAYQPYRFWPELLAAVEKIVAQGQSVSTVLTRDTLVQKLNARGIFVRDMGNVERAWEAVRQRQSSEKLESVHTGQPAKSVPLERRGGEPKEGVGTGLKAVDARFPPPFKSRARKQESPPAAMVVAGTAVVDDRGQGSGGQLASPKPDQAGSTTKGPGQPEVPGPRAGGSNLGGDIHIMVSGPAVTHDDSDKKQPVGLGFTRVRHGEKPKRKVRQPEAVPDLDRNINSKDEVACKMLESVFGGNKTASAYAGDDQGWKEIKHIVGLGMSLDAQCSIGKTVRTSSGIKDVRHRKQLIPRRILSRKYKPSSIRETVTLG